MKCTDTIPVLGGVPGAIVVDWERCDRIAAFRVSVPTDPWPLQYPCTNHLSTTVLALGGDCRVTMLTTHDDLPAAREPDKARVVAVERYAEIHARPATFDQAFLPTVPET